MFLLIPEKSDFLLAKEIPEVRNCSSNTQFFFKSHFGLLCFYSTKQFPGKRLMSYGLFIQYIYAIHTPKGFLLQVALYFE